MPNDAVYKIYYNGHYLLVEQIDEGGWWEINNQTDNYYCCWMMLDAMYLSTCLSSMDCAIAYMLSLNYQSSRLLHFL